MQCVIALSIPSSRDQVRVWRIDLKPALKQPALNPELILQRLTGGRPRPVAGRKLGSHELGVDRTVLRVGHKVTSQQHPQLRHYAVHYVAFDRDGSVEEKSHSASHTRQGPRGFYNATLGVCHDPPVDVQVKVHRDRETLNRTPANKAAR